MASKQRNKGRSYETEVAQWLTEITEMEWSRTVFSGAFTGGVNKHRASNMDERQAQIFKGDICPPVGTSIVIECKNYAEDSLKGGFHGVITGASSTLSQWLHEVRYDAEATTDNEIPHTLFFKITRRGEFAVLPQKWFDLTSFNIPKTLYPYDGDIYQIIPIEYIEGEILEIFLKTIKTK